MPQPPPKPDPCTAGHWADADRREYRNFLARREYGPNFATNAQYLGQQTIDAEHAHRQSLKSKEQTR